jgi:uncharacterized protein YjbI with pentapeptide repeats
MPVEYSPSITSARIIPSLLRCPPERVKINLSESNLSEVNLRKTNLAGANLESANLSGANLSGTNLLGANLSGANLAETDLKESILRMANLAGANLASADLREANLRKANLAGANLASADLREANLRMANLTGANLNGASLESAILIATRLSNADLTGCRVYGVAAWDLQLEGAKQDNLIITQHGQTEITVDSLEVAQFIYLLLQNEKNRHFTDTISSKAVLILGRFTPERKAVLDVLRENLRRYDYLPILFDFEKPTSKSSTETMLTLAHLARFIIADLTDSTSMPYELAMLASRIVIPVQPILLSGQSVHTMFSDLRLAYHGILEPYIYEDVDQLIKNLGTVIQAAEAKALELRGNKAGIT